MDKELLRWSIIIAGGVVILAMILWSYLKRRRKQRNINFYDQGNPLDNIDESLVISQDNDDFDIVPLGSALDDDVDPLIDDYEPDNRSFKEDYPEEHAVRQAEDEIQKQAPQPAAHWPALIQFSIVARDDEGFNGAELKAAFDQAGLIYGESVQVFERLDENNLVDFTVASMVNPGTFPAQGLEQFSCPGIVFFMQPPVLQDPAQVFEEFIQTMKALAVELDGVMWDHQRQPLTEETISEFRQLFQQ